MPSTEFTPVSAAPDVAVALFVDAGSDGQIREDWNSPETKIPKEFWDELKDAGQVHREAAVPTV